MTTIAPFAAGSYGTARNTQNLLNLKTQLDGLSTQLSTGKTADTYGGLGISRTTSLSAHATLSALDGYDHAIDAAQTRVSLVSASLTQVASLTTTFRTSVTNAPLNNAGTATNNAQLARNGLDAAIEALNQQVDGQYLFGGRISDTPPVASTASLLYGDATGDGLSTLVDERIDADLGNDLASPNTGLGRLTIDPPGSGSPATPTNRVSLTEENDDAVRAAFGFGLPSQPTTTGSSLSVAYTPATATSPASFSVDVASLPKAGDSITVQLALHDGTTTTLTLTAQNSAAGTSTTDFAIGATPDQTASNLSGALQRALQSAGQSTLAASSVVKATQDFFTGSPVPRITGLATHAPAYLTTQTALDTAGLKTVKWYRGEVSAAGDADARASASVRTGATSTAELGARANETAIRSALMAFAAGALSNAETSMSTDAARWKAVAQRTTALLPGTGDLEATASSFGLASSALKTAKDSNQTTRATLQGSLDGVENVSTEEVAAKLLAVQNRLQASYQVTASLSKLSLVNYMS
ncbi:flagellin [Methylobacterium sp. A54F]